MAQNLKWTHKMLIRSIVKKMLNRRDEDMEQEIYLHLWQKYPAYQEQDKLNAWIRVVAVNCCKDYLKRQSQKLLAASVNEEEAGLEAFSIADDPEKAWIVKCRRNLVLKALNELPKPMRDTLILTEFEDLSYEEAAHRLNISVGTVKSRIHNAKQKLHQKLSYLELS